MTKIKLAYGIREGHIVHISEIGPDEKGEKCNCTCPVCNGILVAKLKDDRRQRHFAHKASNNCDISHAQETGLHRLAKEIIRDNRSILVPGLAISRREIVSDITDLSAAAEVDVNLPNSNNACPVGYDSVDLEKSFEDIIADAVIMRDGKPCIVEVAVTHFIGEDKIKKLEELGIPAFEIDLSGLLKTPQTRESIIAAVLSDETDRQWVFNPKRKRLLEEKRAEFQNKYNAVVQKRELAEKRKQEYRLNNIGALQRLMEPENYAAELERLRNNEKAAWWLKRFVFSKGLAEYPFYMDIPITGEFVFSCDRRIWQGKLFEDYVYRRFGEDLCVFTISQIRRRIFKGNMIIQYDKDKTYRTMLLLNGQKQEVSFSYDVVKRYFDYLDLLGFVSHAGYEWFSEGAISLDSPNPQAASMLNDILKSIHGLPPDVNQIIKDELLTRLPESEKNRVLTWDER